MSVHLFFTGCSLRKHHLEILHLFPEYPHVRHSVAFKYGSIVMELDLTQPPGRTLLEQEIIVAGLIVVVKAGDIPYGKRNSSP